MLLLPLTGAAHAQTPPAFAPCTACHSVTPGKTGFGPNLHGVTTRKAGSLPGYAYSPALKASGIVWNAQTLDRWLSGPQKMVPGNKMPFPGIPDPVRRKQVIDFLLTLR